MVTIRLLSSNCERASSLIALRDADSRKRRKKCDEARPACSACRERGADCDYGEERLRSQVARRTRPPQALQVQPKAVSPSGNPASLLTHFHSSIARLLSFSSASQTDPFTLHILPLIADSAIVCAAVEALSAAHLSNIGTLSARYADYLHSRTLVLFAGNVCRDGLMEFDTEVNLVTSLMLIYYEIVLGSSLGAAYSHLHGAKAIFEAHVNVPTASPGPRTLFLIKVLRYFDVILALSTKQPLLKFELKSPLPSEPVNARDIEIDEVFGFTEPLWPMLECLADLQARLLQEGEVAIDQVVRLEERISNWDIKGAIAQVPGMDNIYGEAMLQIALSHKYSALLSLYSTFSATMGHDSGYTIQVDQTQVAYRTAFESLLRVSVLSQTMSTILWPLYTVSMVAESTSDQLTLQTIFDRFFEQHHMNVVRSAGEIVLKRWHKELMEQKSFLVLLG